MSETRPDERRSKRSWWITTPSIGEAWLQGAAEIMSAGTQSSYDGLAIRELLMATLDITEPDPTDALIERYAEPERLAWMHANFTDHARVAALADADSYATRLYDYGRAGRDQIRWITERLRSDPLSRSATIFRDREVGERRAVRESARHAGRVLCGRAPRSDVVMRDTRYWQLRRFAITNAAACKIRGVTSRLRRIPLDP